MKLNCLICEIEFNVFPYRKKAKCCSQKCRLEYLHSLPVSKETRKKMGKAHSNEKHWNWKGENVSYRNLHQWVNKKLGKPQKCEFCGKEKTTPKSIHLANKSGKYKRDLSDWIALCVSCHSAYDKGRNSIIKKYNHV